MPKVPSIGETTDLSTSAIVLNSSAGTTASIATNSSPLANRKANSQAHTNNSSSQNASPQKGRYRNHNNNQVYIIYTSRYFCITYGWHYLIFHRMTSIPLRVFRVSTEIRWTLISSGSMRWCNSAIAMNWCIKTSERNRKRHSTARNQINWMDAKSKRNMIASLWIRMMIMMRRWLNVSIILSCAATVQYHRNIQIHTHAHIYLYIKYIIYYVYIYACVENENNNKQGRICTYIDIWLCMWHRKKCMHLQNTAQLLCMYVMYKIKYFYTDQNIICQ